MKAELNVISPMLRSLLGIAILVMLSMTSVRAQDSNQTLGPVDLAFFGLNNNRSGEAVPSWPTVRFGSWRLWDSQTDWPKLEPERGRWEFSELDRMVSEAQSHGVNLLLVLAHSPAWASARPQERSVYGPGAIAEPANIDDWMRYVRTVAQRYKGRLREYQVWNEPSDAKHYSGNVQQLVELTCAAHRVLKSVDSEIKVVSPASADGGGNIRYLGEFLRQGGAACIDVVAHHFYVYRRGPEAMVPMIRAVRHEMAQSKVAHLPLWSTELGWWIARTDGQAELPIVANGGWRKLDAGLEAGATIQRAFLLARSEGISRLYWYAWRSQAWGLADRNGVAKPAVNYWNDLVDRLLKKRVGPCTGQGGDWACEVLDGLNSKTTWRWSDPTALKPREGPSMASSTEAELPR